MQAFMHRIESSALLTDLYQLTMLQAYVEAGMEQTAAFELFVRRLPPERNFLLAAGLEQALDFLEHVAFTADELAWLEGTGRFRPRFLDWLGGFRFEGEVAALAEGTAFFADEPLLRVSAPLPQAQLVESRVLNIVHYQTIVASKAARCVLAAGGRGLVDFGLRRSHGAEAGLFSARASYLGGFAGTATVLAGKMFGIPTSGTMAHSFVQAHSDESQAFEHFARSEPGNVVLLIDTYDTEEGARKVVALAPRLREAGIAVKGVRLDSGDLADHARRVRAILDAGGLSEVRIVASGSLDEWALREIDSARAPIDLLGVGTRMNTVADAPYLDCAYKLVEYAGLPQRKRSEGKAYWPGRKQVYRTRQDGRLSGDVVALEGDDQPGEPLLAVVMRGGRRVADLPGLEQARRRAARELAALPAELRALESAPRPYPVRIAPSLHAAAREVDARTGSVA